MVIKEKGKEYTVDDSSGLITKAKEATEEEAIADEYRLDDRVEVAGKVGQVVSMTPNIYGAAFGVRFDDGSVDEFAEVQLKRSSVEKTHYDSPIQEIFARYDQYQIAPSYTEEEIEWKEAEARWLNLRASSLQTSTSRGGFEGDPKLDEIVLITRTDLADFKNIRESIDHRENKNYLDKQARYQLSEEIRTSNAPLGLKGDASWLGDAIEGMEVTETTDADLAARATEMVSQLSKEQLQDEEFMTLAASFQHEYLQADDDQKKKFAGYLDYARAERLKNMPEQRVAAVEDLTDIDPSAIFL